jgi:hypothetical protein
MWRIVRIRPAILLIAGNKQAERASLRVQRVRNRPIRDSLRYNRPRASPVRF